MNFFRYRLFGGIIALAISGLAIWPEQAGAQENATQEMEVLTRGPVHEAFAGTVSYDPVRGILVSAKPPEAIEEIPPEQQLEGDNVVWIPGYWAWDEDQNDFIWVSGIWRNLPPGRQWVPGYWSEAEGQYQWTSGYWANTDTTEVSYLPEPPHSVEAGPNIEAPSDDHVWIPGNWAWAGGHYAWRVGYWTGCRPGWIYQPSCYRWTHRGYVYVDGYWDYPVVTRGVVFAPVYFNHGYYNRPGFCYTPSLVVSISVFTNHLFLRPNYCHYYFGDYYAPRYYDSGYYASFYYHSGRRGYDPIYAYQSWENRHDRTWQQRRRDDFQFRRDHQDARPPHTWTALGIRPEAERARGRNFDLAEPLAQVAGNRTEGRQRFRSLDQPTRERFVSQRQAVRKFGQERQRMETTRGARPQIAASADRAKSPRSPIAAGPSANVARAATPPTRTHRTIPGQPDTRSGDRTSVRPQANRASEPQTAGGTPKQPDRTAVPRPDRNFQAEPKRAAVPPPRETKPSAAVPHRAETTRSRPSQPRQAVPQDGRKTQPEVRRQAASPPPYRPRPEASRQAIPRQIHPESPAVKRQQPAPQQRVAPAPQQHIQPQRQQAPQQPARRQDQPQARQKQGSQPAETRPANPKPNSSPRAQPQKETDKERRDRILRTI